MREDDEHKNRFFEGCSRFIFKNQGVALGMALKFDISVEKGLEIKERKF